MPNAYAASIHLACTLIIVAGLAGPVQATVRVAEPFAYASHRVTCDFPVRLTDDCSIWQGATRPIALGDYRMSLAAGDGGRTILVSRVRPGPDHNGLMFRQGLKGTPSSCAVEAISAALRAQGISLERMQTIRRGRRIEGYYLEFSDNAYDYLKRYTVLESEHWLPRQGRVQ